MREATEYEKKVATDLARTALNYEMVDSEIKAFLVREAMTRTGTIVTAVVAKQLIDSAEQWYNKEEQ